MVICFKRVLEVLTMYSTIEGMLSLRAIKTSIHLNKYHIIINTHVFEEKLYIYIYVYMYSRNCYINRDYIL